jgi:hypothetical protein
MLDAMVVEATDCQVVGDFPRFCMYMATRAMNTIAATAIATDFAFNLMVPYCK